MAFAVGTVLAPLIALFARLTRLDRDRAFYPTMLIVIALYYILFAAMGASAHALRLESIQLVVFTSVAVVGFRSSLWWAAAGLAGHGVYDLLHRRLFTNPGAPVWWPSFCSAFDIVIALILALLLYRRTVLARDRP